MKSKSLKAAGIFALVLLAIGYFIFLTPVFGAPSFNTQAAATAAATTTITYMTPGAATTTLVYDSSQINGTNQTNTSGNYYSADSAILAVQLTGSSTATVLVTQLEYSTDNIDWYSNSMDVFAAGAIAIATPSTSYTWTFASSTIGGVTPLLAPPASVGTGANRGDRNAKIVEIKTPVRYVRAVFTMTGANGSIYATIVPKKEAK